MKQIKLLGMMLAMLAVCVSFSACSSDDDDAKDSTTVWEAETSGSGTALIYRLSFSGNSATYKTIVKATGAVMESSSYTIAKSGLTIILTPELEGNAILRAQLDSDNLRLTLYNTSYTPEKEFSYKFYKK